MEGVFRALLAAARHSSDDVVAVLDRATRHAAPTVDATLFFGLDDDALRCRNAYGARTEHFAVMAIERSALALPARAALLARPLILRVASERVMSGDRFALAVPMVSASAVVGVWYAASPSAPFAAGNESIVTAAGYACEAYLLARERERDRRDATYDSLTGVLAPRAFRTCLHDCVAARDGAVLSLWFVDTDHFKRINDDRGHETGDLVLQRMAALLRAHAVAGIDVVGRKGGDEFCMLVTGVPKMRAIERAGAFCTAARRHDFGVSFAVTASVGVASLPFDASSAATLLELADAAMYFAKRSGRDRVAYAVEGVGFALYE